MTEEKKEGKEETKSGSLRVSEDTYGKLEKLKNSFPDESFDKIVMRAVLALEEKMTMNLLNAQRTRSLDYVMEKGYFPFNPELKQFIKNELFSSALGLGGDVTCVLSIEKYSQVTFSKKNCFVFYREYYPMFKFVTGKGYVFFYTLTVASEFDTPIWSRQNTLYERDIENADTKTYQRDQISSTMQQIYRDSESDRYTVLSVDVK